MVGAAVIPLDRDFAQCLADPRHEAGLTQQALADRIGIHVCDIRRYEAGTSQPAPDVLRNQGHALDSRADSLLFHDADRGPYEDLRLQFEAAAAQLDEEGRQLVRAPIRGVLLRHEARRWAFAG